METRVTQMTVVPEGEPIFSENAFIISIDDEAGGEFLSVMDNHRCEKITVNPEDWPALRSAINKMMRNIVLTKH